MVDILLGKERHIDTSISLPSQLSSVSAGRRFVRETLRDWGANEFLDSAELVASELITNALLHAHSAPVLRMRLSNGCLRLEVGDNSPLGPVRKFYGTQAATGRGMVLVERLTAAWGTDVKEDGKTVWCEFRSGDEASERATG